METVDTVRVAALLLPAQRLMCDFAISLKQASFLQVLPVLTPQQPMSAHPKNGPTNSDDVFLLVPGRFLEFSVSSNVGFLL